MGEEFPNAFALGTVGAAQDGLARVLPHLERGGSPDPRWPDAKGEYWALCPFHADTHPTNFSVSERGFHCFACGAKGSVRKLASHLGLEGTDPEPDGLTLEAYARTKKLSVGFLAELGLAERRNRRGPYVEMPYRDEQGRTVARAAATP